MIFAPGSSCGRRAAKSAWTAAPCRARSCVRLAVTQKGIGRLVVARSGTTRRTEDDARSASEPVEKTSRRAAVDQAVGADA